MSRQDIYLDNIREVNVYNGLNSDASVITINLMDSYQGMNTDMSADMTLEAAKDLLEQLKNAVQIAQYGR